VRRRKRRRWNERRCSGSIRTNATIAGAVAADVDGVNLQVMVQLE